MAAPEDAEAQAAIAALRTQLAADPTNADLQYRYALLMKETPAPPKVDEVVVINDDGEPTTHFA
jgi:hypothetical protein